jgi:hypothetical protein
MSRLIRNHVWAHKYDPMNTHRTWQTYTCIIFPCAGNRLLYGKMYASAYRAKYRVEGTGLPRISLPRPTSAASERLPDAGNGRSLGHQWWETLCGQNE